MHSSIGLRHMAKLYPSAIFERWGLRLVMLLIVGALMLQAFVWMQHSTPESWTLSGLFSAFCASLLE